MRIRHFGWFANRCRAGRLAEVRAAIEAAPPQDTSADPQEPAPFNGYPCPFCRQGRLRIAAALTPKRLTGG